LPRPYLPLNITNYNIMRLVARFPPFNTLEIHGVANPIFPIAITNTKITQLDISGAGLLDILAMLQCFPRLRSMTISASVLLNGGTRPTYHFPSIEYIRVVDTMGEDWMKRAFFPKLTTIFCGTASEAFRAFLSRHPSITEVECVPHLGALGEIVRIAARLKTLHLAPPLGIFDRVVHMYRQKTFPSLEVLTITAHCPPNNLTLAEFEAVVCVLCLPIRHPWSHTRDSSFLVSTFAIITMDSATAGGHLHWHESRLYKESTKKIDEKDPMKVYLSWPEWE
jgi:hypothetical protein